VNDMHNKAYIFGTIFTLSNKLQMLGDQMDPKLTVKQWMFLAGIVKSNNHSPTISEVAGLIGSSRQNVKKMAIILEKRGFISMSKDKRDARIVRLTLTECCNKYLKQREQKENAFIEAIFQNLGSQDLDLLARAIRKLDGNVDRILRN